MQIVFAQDQSERLNGERITAAGVTQDVPPASSSLDVVTAPSSHRRPTSRIDNDAISMVKRRRQTGLTVTASDDSRFWPNPQADFLEQPPILLGAATGEENSRPIDFRWQPRENLSQTFGRCQTQVRWGQFSLVDHVKFPGGIIPTCLDYRFYEYPSGFRAAAFDPENALAGFHDCVL
jgi:hypothetical protein